jgi:hypothetical protein
MFRRFVDYSSARDHIVSTGHKIIIDPRLRRGAVVSLRIDVDEVEDDGGRTW